MADRDNLPYPTSCCQYCLAASEYASVAPTDRDDHCPVCGSPYRGPRRSKEFQVLVESGVLKGE